MNNLTSLILSNNYNYDIEEWTKQGSPLQFDSGIEQRIVTSSIPALEVRVSYSGLTWAEYELMRNAYENNHSNSFIVDFSDNISIEDYVLADYVDDNYILETVSFIDMRPEVMNINATVWVFKEYEFKIDARTLLYSGYITLVTSVFFNFSQYQDLFDQESTYTRSANEDQSFIDVLEFAQPYEAKLKYSNNAIFSNIGQSARHAKNKGGLKRYWGMSWLLNESAFVKLLTFYRKNSGIMGEFGFPDYGTNSGILLRYLDVDYLEDQGDYIVLSAEDNLSNARFMNDSFKYQKRVDNLYKVEADFIEVKL